MPSRRPLIPYAGRSRSPAENLERKAYAVAQLTAWMGDEDPRRALLDLMFPRGIEAYPAVRLLAAIGPLRAREHYVVADGVPVPPPDESPSRRAWRELWV